RRRGVGVPVGRALDAKPVDVAVLGDVGQPRHLGVLGVTIVDQRVKLWPPEAAPERSELTGPQILLGEHQDGMRRERLFDPGQGFGIQRPRQIDAKRLSSERALDRTKRGSATLRLLLLARCRRLILEQGPLARQEPLVYPHSTTRTIRAGVLALVLASIGLAGRPVLAEPTTEREATMAVTVVPRSESGVFRDTALLYLDGRIDAGAPERLTKALDTINGRIAIWLNSPGGNLFAGMQLGRVIRKHGASTHIIDSRTLLPGECYSACSLAFLGGVYRFNDNGARYGVHRASFQDGPTTGDRDLAPELSASIKSYIREMGVDVRLFDLWVKAAPDEMYVLSERQAKDLGVVN